MAQLEELVEVYGAAIIYGASAQKLLGKLGLKQTYLRRQGKDGQRVRVYAFVPPNDGTEAVWDIWQKRDELASLDGNSNINTQWVDAA